MYSIALLCVCVCIASPYQMLCIHIHYSLYVCICAIPLLDSTHTRIEMLCVALCVVSPYQTLHIHADCYNLSIVLYTVSPYQILCITQQMQCAIAHQCVCVISPQQIPHIHSDERQHTTQGAYGIVQHRSFTHSGVCMYVQHPLIRCCTYIHTQPQGASTGRDYAHKKLHAPMTMCVCIASLYQMLCIHTQCAVMCVVPLLDNTHNSTGCVCGGYAHRSFTHP